MQTATKNSAARHNQNTVLVLRAALSEAERTESAGKPAIVRALKRDLLEAECGLAKVVA